MADLRDETIEALAEAVCAKLRASLGLDKKLLILEPTKVVDPSAMKVGDTYIDEDGDVCLRIHPEETKDGLTAVAVCLSGVGAGALQFTLRVARKLNCTIEER